MGKQILYGKIGRAVPLQMKDCSSLGGDIEFVSTLKLLAERHPEDTFVIASRNSGEYPSEVGLPSNVWNPWCEFGDSLKADIVRHGLRYANLSVEDQLRLAQIIDQYTLPMFTHADEIIMWAGQHGTTSTPLPGIKDRSILTKPQDSSALYAGFLLRGINYWRDQNPRNREEIWLNADPRNYLKLRDLKWPLRYPVLTQFNFENNIKHERYAHENDDFVPLSWRARGVVSENGVWKAKVQNVYSRIEINGMMPGTPFDELLTFNSDPSHRGRFGIIVNETRVAGVHPTKGRKAAMRDYVLPAEPNFIHGTWTKDSMAELGINPTPLSYDKYVPKLQSVMTTLTTPASGSGWATAKPWEAFAAGTVCFFHPMYDTQDNILGDAPEFLRKYLRVNSPRELRSKIDEVNEDLSLWYELIEMQSNHFEKATYEAAFIKMIEGRIYG